MFKETLNKQGFECTIVDNTVKLFVDDAKNQNWLWSLEVGAGFGTDTCYSVEKGIKLYCNDLDERHLTYIKNSLGYKDNIKYLVGDFLQLEIKKNSLHSIYSSRVIHFLNPEDLEKAFSLFYGWLKPKGRLFITVETPFLKNWKKFIPEYKRRKYNGDKYPGFIDNPVLYEDSGYSNNLPEYIHFFDKTSLTEIAVRNQFHTENIVYIDRYLAFPKALLDTGKESVMGIFVK